MYNTVLKTDFIRQYTRVVNTTEVAVRLFNLTGPYEERLGADICTWSADELQPVLKKLTSMRSESKWVMLEILKEYVRWCISIRVFGACDDILSMDITGIEKIKQQMVSGPLHLQRFLDAVYNPESKEGVDNIYRCFLWLAFGGASMDDAVNIQCSQVDLIQMSITYGQTHIPIYREAVPAFYHAMTLTRFRSKHTNLDYTMYRERAEGDDLLRMVNRSDGKCALRTAVSKANRLALDNGKTDLHLNYYRLSMSGLFYRMYDAERAGFPPGFSDAAVRFMSGKTYSLPERMTLKNKQNAIEREYMTNYQRWKFAFSV